MIRFQGAIVLFLAGKKDLQMSILYNVVIMSGDNKLLFYKVFFLKFAKKNHITDQNGKVEARVDLIA